jgi:hypothetical protein
MKVLRRWWGIINLAKPTCLQIGVIANPKALGVKEPSRCLSVLTQEDVFMKVNKG